MPIQIGASLDHDFDQPLGLMSDCHRRIEKFLAALLAVAATGGRRLSEDERAALDVGLRYFAAAAPKHTADEEASLFPRLRAALEGRPDPRAQAILDRLAVLEADHVAADAAHQEVDRLGRQWLAEDTLPAGDAARLEALLRLLQTTYTQHIEHEDQAVFPLAAEVLPPAEIAAIGQEMAARRGSLTCSQRKALQARPGWPAH